MAFFGFGKKEKDKMKTGLEKTRTGFWGSIMNTLTGSVIDDDMYDELEEKLILADVGGDVAVHLVDKLRDRVQEKGLKTGEQAADALRDIIAEEMTPEAEMDLSGKPAVILVIGVNGVGKTTTIAKLAGLYKKQGRRVMLAAGDTFRAAASEQLELWADRAGVPLVQAGMGADPAAVIFDAVKSATARGYDMVIADTAGRLHNKQNLMNELNKISRILDRELPGASKEVLLVLDVALIDGKLAGHFVGNFLDDGGEGAAGSAPRCPEVHEDGLLGAADDVVERILGDCLCSHGGPPKILWRGARPTRLLTTGLYPENGR